MEVTLEIPNEMYRQFEYIPTQLLPNILLNMIKQGMAEKPSEQKVSNWGMDEVASMLQELIKSEDKQQEYSAPLLEPEPIRGQEIICDGADIEIEDIMDLMK